MTAILTRLLPWSPVLFGLGFIAPLIASVLQDWFGPRVFGYPVIALGLAAGGGWGLFAKRTGRWL